MFRVQLASKLLSLFKLFCCLRELFIISYVVLCIASARRATMTTESIKNDTTTLPRMILSGHEGHPTIFS